MKTIITGYQYKSNKHFGGVYEFPNNLDKEEIHLPPNTTLVAPPKNIPKGKEAMWYVDKWILVDEEVIEPPEVIEPLEVIEPPL